MLERMEPAQARADADRRNGGFWSLGVAVALVSALAVVPVHRLWDASLRVPFNYSGDANSVAIVVKGVIDHGWYWTNPNLGAPFSQQLVDYPFSETVHVALIRLLGLVFGDYALVLNFYYLLGYVLVGVTAAWALHRLGLSRPVAAAGAVLYSFLPYHQTRGEGHLFLGAYFVVPIACYLVLRSLGGRPILDTNGERHGWRRVITRRNGIVVATCIVIGATSSYYAVFTLLLLAFVGVVQLWQRADLRRVVATLVLLGSITAGLVANMAPTLVYHARHGDNARVAHREVADSERQGLKVAAMLLPRQDHRIDLLDRVTRKYDEASPVESELGQSLGALGAVGLVGLLALTVLAPFRRRDSTPLERRVAPLGALSVAAILLATVGGLSSLVAFVVPEIRGWNRISVFIAFFVMVALGRGADAALAATRTPVAVRRLAPALLGVVVLAGLFDQTRNPEPYAPTKAEFASDEAFVRDVEGRLGRDAMVFQMPHVLFPESPSPVDMAYYDHARGYLHSDTLRWSWGGIKGRPRADWAEPFVNFRTPAAEAVEIIAAAGFSGLYIDRFGFDDRGAALERTLRALAPQTPLVSRNRRLVLYDIRDYAAALRRADPARFRALRDAVLNLPEA